MYNFLYWGDSPTVATGFGHVGTYICKTLKNFKPGSNVDVLAINYFDTFPDQKEYPYSFLPARLENPSDPHGRATFIRCYESGKYDLIFVLNDMYVTHGVVDSLIAAKKRMQAAGKKIPKLVYYFPIDCCFLVEASAMFEFADLAVTYTQWGLEKVREQTTRPCIYIPHGINRDVYNVKTSFDKQSFKAQQFGITDPSVRLLVSANRNSRRKDFGTLLAAYKEWSLNQTQPSRLYCHTAIQDGDIDLRFAIKDLKFDSQHQVLFPRNYDSTKPIPSAVLASIYRASDLFITTSLGEGWGLTMTDALASGAKVVAPHNTSHIEILTGRGFLYPCRETRFVDNQGVRKAGRIEDIVTTMDQALITPLNQGPVQAYCDSLSWTNVMNTWNKTLKGLLK